MLDGSAPHIGRRGAPAAPLTQHSHQDATASFGIAPRHAETQVKSYKFSSNNKCNLLLLYCTYSLINNKRNLYCPSKAIGGRSHGHRIDGHGRRSRLQH
jgi:hypothetical protein